MTVTSSVMCAMELFTHIASVHKWQPFQKMDGNANVVENALIVVLEHQGLVNLLDGIPTILYAILVINKEIKD
jgi:hypothetical protein